VTATSEYGTMIELGTGDDMTGRTRRRLAVALATCVGVTMLATTGPTASAAGTPVTIASVRYSVPLAGGGQVSVGSRSAITVSTDGALHMSASSGGITSLTLQPPISGRFSAGPSQQVTVENTSSTPPTDQVTMAVLGSPSQCRPVSPTATLNVATVDYDVTGALATLSGSLSLHCADTGGDYLFTLRVSNADPVTELDFGNEPVLSTTSVTTAGVPDVGTTGVARVQLRNTGTTALALGAVTVSGVTGGWTATPDAVACGTSIDVGRSCVMSVFWTSGGGPATFTLTVASPDLAAGSITTTVRTPDTAPAPSTVTTRGATDGVALSWTSLGYPKPDTWDVQRSSDGVTWTTLATLTARTTYGDTTLGVGESAQYRVVGRKITFPRTTDLPSAAVVGTRNAAPSPADLALDSEVDSVASETATVGGSLVRLSSIPPAPGSYAVPRDLAVSVTGYRSIACVGGRGTLTVRDVELTATGALFRADWSLRLTCADGSSFAEERRFHTAGATPLPTTEIYSLDRTSVGVPNGAYVGQTTTFIIPIVNRGSTPLPLPAITITTAGMPASWWSKQVQCTRVIAANTECDVVVAVTPRAPANGAGTLHVAGVGLLGNTDIPLPVVAAADTTAPTLTVEPALPFAHDFDHVLNARWTDAQSGPGTEDIRVRRASYWKSTLPDWSYPAASQGADGNSFDDVMVPGDLAPGVETCVSIRARDLAGNVTPWSAMRCQSSALDDSVLTGSALDRRHGDWREYMTTPQLAQYSAYQGSSRRGASFTGPVVHARQIAVLGISCPSCGQLAVYVGATRLGTLDTRASRPHHRAWFATPMSRALHIGRLMLVVVSTGKPVYVDGVAIRLV
jgi:hypothetical protein